MTKRNRAKQMFNAESRERVLKAGCELFESGDSPSDAAERFSHTVRRLMDVCIDINSETKPPAISPGIISLVSNIINQIEVDAYEPIMHTLAERGCPLIEDIRDKNIQTFIENAKTIFSDVPKIAVDTVVSVLKQDKLSKENIDRVFEVIHPLMRMAMKRHAMVAFEESQLMSSNSSIKHSVNIDSLDHAISVFGLSAKKH